MKYFIDTEFLEGTQTKRIFGFPYGKTKPTIDLISIGIVSEDGREYYAISKDFNLKEAWNRCDIKDRGIDGIQRTYWIRENVLKPIWFEFYIRLFEDGINVDFTNDGCDNAFTFNNFKEFIKKYGKSNEQIAEEVKEFINNEKVEVEGCRDGAQWLTEKAKKYLRQGYLEPEFYGYYCDFDWVVFAWLFGKMIDLPKGFPMYCIDLKQMLDEKQEELKKGNDSGDIFYSIEHRLDYPKPTNEHNALADARFNRELYKFIQSL